jgi:hypothetical protein
VCARVYILQCGGKRGGVEGEEWRARRERGVSCRSRKGGGKVRGWLSQGKEGEMFVYLREKERVVDGKEKGDLEEGETGKAMLKTSNHQRQSSNEHPFSILSRPTTTATNNKKKGSYISHTTTMPACH